VVAAAWLPLAALALGAWRDTLGANPVETLTHETGQWALRLLLASLAVTPLRRALSLPGLAPYRRSFGLLAFAYATVHFGIFLVLDLGLEPAFLVEEVVERPYVTAGFAAWLLLLPLALTSNRPSQRALGRRWIRLHRAVYLAAACAVVHFLWLVKADLREPAVYAAVAGLLLAARLPGFLGRRRRP
jgi:sulfoxide reductase heme-binding subunit YedZ